MVCLLGNNQLVARVVTDTPQPVLLTVHQVSASLYPTICCMQQPTL